MENKRIQWTSIRIPIEIHEDLTILQEKLRKIYGVRLSYWEVISYLLRFYEQNKKDHGKL